MNNDDWRIDRVRLRLLKLTIAYRVSEKATDEPSTEDLRCCTMREEVDVAWQE